MQAPDLADRYVLLAPIAEGGMGQVWRGRDVLLEVDVAIKLLGPHADEIERERFRAEARHSAGLAHPGIASVYDYGEQDGYGAWLVMELAAGRSLADVLADGPLGVATTLGIIAQTAAALGCAHEAGVVHRDIKPANLTVSPDGAVKVTDFGVAHRLDSSAGAPGLVIGTAYYASPEQALGHEVTAASDLYSLGVVGYECLTGHRPFDGGDPRALAHAHLHTAPPELPDAVPAELRQLVGALLEKDPLRRPASAAAVSRAALAMRSGLDQPAPTSRGRARRRTALTAGALLAVVGLAIGARTYLVTDDVTVPELAAGTPAATAQERLQQARLSPRILVEPSALQPRGALLRLEPAGGSPVQRGSAVTLVVSAGTPIR